MTVTINIPDEFEAKLKAQASECGEDLSTYVARLVRRAMRVTEGERALAQYRKQVEASGMSDEVLDQFHEAVRDEVWRDQSRTSQP